jgi:CHASE3 domain sensor protein
MQATREDCPPAQLLQLLLPEMYPEDAASELAADASSVLAAEARAKEQRAMEQRAKEQRAMMQRNWIIGGAVGAALVCVIVLWKRR